ncbi:MAG: glycoside hydrolase family 15 protein [Thermomicrobiales bacterium]
MEYLDGYLPIEDHGLIGDGATAALVGRDGAISWLCVPRFDKVPIFSSILDRDRGGAFRVEAGVVLGARHRYLADSPILITELKVATGVLRITDLMPLRNEANLANEAAAATGELLRCIEVISGEVTFSVALSIRGGIDAVRDGDNIRIWALRYPEIDLQLEASRPIQGAGGSWTLSKGESVSFCLRWNGGIGASSVDAPVSAVTNTIAGWSTWLQQFSYAGPHHQAVKRSAITIKLLDYVQNGALIAAPTTSLPELIGGERNWDYRYVWIRDASFAVYALRRLGFQEEAWGFLQWVLEQASASKLNVMYTLDGSTAIEEHLDPDLSGYRNSGPVRWGNGAAGQLQHDVFGEILDCAFQWTTHGGVLSKPLWSELRGLVDRAANEWNKPDQGIWEVRSQGRVQTYSAGICQVALNRGARLARRFGFDGDVAHWEATATKIQETILRDSWNEQGQYLAQGLGGDSHIDSAVLGLPIRRVIDAKHPRMVATVRAVAEHLSAGDELLYRYLPEKSPDGLAGGEGAFLLCSYWMIDNLTMQGRIQEAMDRFDQAVSRVNDLGLLPEEIDPGTGRFLGNFPQAFSHLGMISSGFNLGRALAQR